MDLFLLTTNKNSACENHKKMATSVHIHTYYPSKVKHVNIYVYGKAAGDINAHSTKHSRKRPQVF